MKKILNWLGIVALMVVSSLVTLKMGDLYRSHDQLPASYWARYGCKIDAAGEPHGCWIPIQEYNQAFPDDPISKDTLVVPSQSGM